MSALHLILSLHVADAELSYLDVVLSGRPAAYLELSHLTKVKSLNTLNHHILLAKASCVM